MSHVGDVDHVAHPVALPAKGPLHRIGEHVTAHVPDVLVGINRRPARVHTDVGWARRAELGHPPGQCVEQS